MHKHNLANRDANGMLQQTRPTLATYNKKRAQPVTTGSKSHDFTKLQVQIDMEHNVLEKQN